MSSKLKSMAACIVALMLFQAAIGTTAAQNAPAPPTAAADTAGAAGDIPASVDEDKPHPSPRYSAAMKNAGGTGTVIVMVQVGADDKPKSFHVMMSSGARSLDDEAIRTLKSWSYKAAIKNGAPADGYVQVPITFNK